MAPGDAATTAPGNLTTVAVSNPGPRTVHARLYAVRPSGLTPLDGGREVKVTSGMATDVTGTASEPVEVLADGPVAVAGGYASAATGPGILTVPAVPSPDPPV